jgi:protein phosphatase
MYPNINFVNKRENNWCETACCSGIGKRDEQQDNAFCYVDDNQIYAVVCDGMGGLSGGKLASAKAVEVASYTIKKHLEQQTSDYTWMADGIVAADAAVFELTNEKDERLGAGSTFASVYIRDNALHWASAGDSRVYLFHGKDVAQLTTDLNYAFVLDQQRETGAISEQDYQRESTMGEALTSFVGMGNINMIDRNIEPLPLVRGDIILLCSDGLYRTIDSAWLCDILSLCDSMEEAAGFIEQIIAEHGGPGQDNFTCILIRVR